MEKSPGPVRGPAIYISSDCLLGHGGNGLRAVGRRFLGAIVGPGRRFDAVHVAQEGVQNDPGSDQSAVSGRLVGRIDHAGVLHVAPADGIALGVADGRRGQQLPDGGAEGVLGIVREGHAGERTHRSGSGADGTADSARERHPTRRKEDFLHYGWNLRVHLPVA